MSKHTPGPWDFFYSGIDSNQVAVSSQDHKWICKMYAPNNGYARDRIATDERDANARLIAAAPELLSVLSELAESSCYWSEYDVPIGIVDRIKQAIAKATGEPQ